MRPDCLKWAQRKVADLIKTNLKFNERNFFSLTQNRNQSCAGPNSCMQYLFTRENIRYSNKMSCNKKSFFA